MNDKLLSVRLSAQEHQALKRLAANETRTANSWIRSRIVMAAKECGLLANQDDEIIATNTDHTPGYEELTT